MDKKPENALKMARIEKELGVNATYYFRIVKESFDENIIQKLANIGHEIDYHYEDICLARGNFENAIKLFEQHLKKFRGLYPIKTICMHGSPLSKWDNRLIWEKYNYKDYEILGEPYFDIDFNTVYI